MQTMRFSVPGSSTSRRVLVVLMCALALFAAACGGGGDDGDEPAQTSQEDGGGSDDGGSEEADEEAPEEDADDASAACLEGPHDGRRVEVEAVDFAFEPKKISVEAGETVTIVFRNTGTTPHSFTLEDPNCDTDPIFSDEGEVMATFVAPDEDGKFVCTVHPNMTGELSVE